MQVYLASSNPHKLEEFIQIASALELKIDIMGADHAGGMPEIEETGDTFEENARLKAEALLEKVPEDAWVLADDSGLIVDELYGEPGVHSARFAGPAANAVANNIKLLYLLHGIPLEKRTARFSCVLCFAKKGSDPKIFRGECEGHIMTFPSGEEGFGYDPLFRPVGYEDTFANMGNDIKNSISHRGKAVSEWGAFVHRMIDQDAAG